MEKKLSFVKKCFLGKEHTFSLTLQYAHLRGGFTVAHISGEEDIWTVVIHNMHLEYFPYKGDAFKEAHPHSEYSRVSMERFFNRLDQYFHLPPLYVHLGEWRLHYRKHKLSVLHT